MVAAALWGHNWAGQHVRFNSDNTAAVAVLNSSPVPIPEEAPPPSYIHSGFGIEPDPMVRSLYHVQEVEELSKESTPRVYHRCGMRKMT